MNYNHRTIYKSCTVIIEYLFKQIPLGTTIVIAFMYIFM